MIFASIYADNYAVCLDAVKKYQNIEFRLDNTDFSEHQLTELISSGTNCIATCKPGYKTDGDRYKLLCCCLEAGADYIDIDLKDQEPLKENLIRKARDNGKKIIISYHNFTSTPAMCEMTSIIESGLKYKPDILKIACTAKSGRDCARLFSLYDYDLPGDVKLITISMGKHGTMSRIAALCLGAPFMYASIPGETRTAPGQLDYNQLKKIFEIIKHE